MSASFSDHDGDAEVNVDLKNEFIFYQWISWYFKVIYFVYHCQNYDRTKSGTQR